MRKPKRFVYWARDSYYDWGILHFGRVAIPTFVLSMVYVAVGVLVFVLAFFFHWAYVLLGVLFYGSLSLGGLVGLILFIRWVWDSIEISGPGKD